jgi:hypothetical protein
MSQRRDRAFEIQLVRPGTVPNCTKAEASMDRRHFLLSTAAGGLGLILPPVADRILTAVTATQGPLIEPPAHASRTLFAVNLGDCYQLNLDVSGADAPDTYETTWREYLLEAYDGDLELGMSDFGIRREQLNETDTFEAEIDGWALRESPNAKAFQLLSMLDIGPRLRNPSGSLGYINFIDGAGPGHDYRGVHVYDDVSLSLLQIRLNDLRSGIVIKLA